MKLTDGEATNPLWIRLRKHYADRLAQLRAENDGQNLDEKATALLRGRIAECRAFLDMDSPEPDIQVKGM